MTSGRRCSTACDVAGDRSRSICTRKDWTTTSSIARSRPGCPSTSHRRYWAEHMGLPYHQAAIRELERPVAGSTGSGLMALSAGSLSFTRYGYGDLLRTDRRYTVRHRVWFGSQRVLLSADPEGAAAHAQRFQFCGSTGMDLMEPLTFRGRRGSASAGGRRSGYVDATLEPGRDWEKYDAWYRTWGRLTYDAGAASMDAVRQAIDKTLGGPLQRALALASRILPLVTTAYTPSAACDAYWPEIYWNQPLAAAPDPNPYGDTPEPKTFHHASPLDPQLFASMTECAGALVAGESSGKYTPLEVAAWLDRLAADAAALLSTAGAPGAIAQRRAAIDVGILAALGRFFAAKLRAGVLYAVHEQSGESRCPRGRSRSVSPRASGMVGGCWASLGRVRRSLDQRQDFRARALERSAPGHRSRHRTACGRRISGACDRGSANCGDCHSGAHATATAIDGEHARAASRVPSRSGADAGGAPRRNESAVRGVLVPPGESGRALSIDRDGAAGTGVPRSHSGFVHGYRRIHCSITFSFGCHATVRRSCRVSGRTCWNSRTSCFAPSSSRDERIAQRLAPAPDAHVPAVDRGRLRLGHRHVHAERRRRPG